jgi:hypothetical protein
MKKADFVYQFKGTFGPLSPDRQLELEKHKYLRGILPRIKEMEKEIKEVKKETAKDKQEAFNFLMQIRKNHRTWRFQYENGDIYPKEVSPPNIRHIQYAEPHVIITDWYDENPDWYRMPHLIKGFAEEAYLSYELGLWYSAIASAINCCEYVLKYELLRKLNQTDKIKAEELSKDRFFSLGSFTRKRSDYLKQIRLKKYLRKISYLNDVRVSIYHFSPERAKKVNRKGTLEIERDAPISDDMIIPIIAFKVYSIMFELTSSLYNKNKALQHVKEGVKDWMKKRNLKEKK